MTVVVLVRFVRELTTNMTVSAVIVAVTDRADQEIDDISTNPRLQLYGQLVVAAVPEGDALVELMNGAARISGLHIKTL